MSRFLFIFGFESPTEWATNKDLGKDDESSKAIWVHAETEEAALAAGRLFAEMHVTSLFAAHPHLGFPGWSRGGYASWVEAQPSKRFSAVELGNLEEIGA